MIIPLSFIVVTGVGEAVAAALVDTRGGSPQRIALAVPGQIAWDACDCGQLAQTITSIASAKTANTPATDSAAFACGHALMVVSVTLSLVRCVPGTDEITALSLAPPADTLLAAALVLEEDRTVVRTSLLRHLKSLWDEYQIRDFTIGAANSVGPEGVCGGVEITYTITLDNDAMVC